MSKRILYISIPMANHDMDIQRQIAALWQRFFERQEYTVINPFELMDKLNEEYMRDKNRYPTYREYLDNDIAHIKSSNCTDMFLCNGWATSRGCLEEVYTATTLKINFLYESKFKIG